MGLLAREWYQCEEISHLQSCGSPLKSYGLETSQMGLESEDGDQSGSLAFLFDVGTSSQYMDSLVTDWLFESGYDVFHAVDE